MIGLSQMAEPKLEDLPDNARALVTAVESGAGKWMKRQDIAVALGKNKLNAGDIALLDMLAALGFVEGRQTETNAPSKTRWEYRGESSHAG